jgi:hypothetical protein
MDEEMPADHPADNVVRIFPSPETLDDWKAYIAEATKAEKRADQTKVQAILEKGRRIGEFFDKFKAEGQKWGRRLEDLCLDVVGLNISMCRRYIVVAENIGNNVTDISFPGDVQALYYLSRAKRADSEVFNAAAVAGEITRKTNRNKAEVIMHRAEAKTSNQHQRLTQRKEEQRITIPYRDVIDKFRPLIKRVKEQSKRHAATVSFVELSVIAFELGKLADAWMESGPEPGTPSEPVPLNRVRKGR